VIGRSAFASELYSIYHESGSVHVRKRPLLWLIVAVALMIGFLLYRARSGSNLNVTPDAGREIEKARRR
jgi:hypothetical protein